MVDFANGLRLPIIVLGYDPVGPRLFSVSDMMGTAMIPVFSNGEYAKAYQEFFSKKVERNLMTLLMVDYDKVITLFEVIQIADPQLSHVAIDPMPPTLQNAEDKPLCYTLSEYIGKLRTCKDRARKGRKRIRRKKN
jgi:hypothetical protein